MRIQLTEKDRQYIKDNWGKISREKMAAHFHVTVKTILDNARRVGAYPLRKMHTWTSEQKALVRQWYIKRNNNHIAQMLNEQWPEMQMNAKTVCLYARTVLMLKRSASDVSNIRQYDIERGLYKEGSKKKYSKVKVLQPGEPFIAHCDGSPNLFCKTGKKGKKGINAIMYYKIHVWESHNGPVPSDMMVTFKDGNRFNCDITNLYLQKRSTSFIEAPKVLSDGYVTSLLLRQFPKEIVEQFPIMVEVKRNALTLIRELKKQTHASLNS